MARALRKFRSFLKAILCFISLCIIVIAYKVGYVALNRKRTGAETFQLSPLTSDDLIQRRKQWRNLETYVEANKKFDRLPDVIGIGVRKCGTGMLEHFIAQHPLVAVNLSEVHYYDKNPEMGLEYYKKLLPDATTNQLIMEKTPAYFTSLPARLPDIISSDVPQVKLILILCDPVKRAFSDYVMRVRHGSKKAGNITFEQYVNVYLPRVKELFNAINMADDDEDEKLEHVLKFLMKDRCQFSFGHGIYEFFIRRWIEAFPPERIMIVNGEEFINDPGIVIERVQDYLGIPKLLLKGDFVRHPETGLFCLRRWWDMAFTFESESWREDQWRDNLLCSKDGKGLTRSKTAKYGLSKEAAKRLRQFFDPHNEILYNILGQRFDW